MQSPIRLLSFSLCQPKIAAHLNVCCLQPLGQLLHEDGVGEPCFLDAFPILLHRLRWEGRHEAIIGGHVWPGGLYEAPDVLHAVTQIEAGYHTGSIMQPQLDGGGGSGLVHAFPFSADVGRIGGPSRGRGLAA